MKIDRQKLKDTLQGDLRPGTTVTGDIHCGRSSLGIRGFMKLFSGFSITCCFDHC